MKSRLIDRVFTVLAVLSVPLLLLAGWRGTRSLRDTARSFLVQQKQAALADSIIQHYSGRAILGNVDAAITLIEFMDYECPACRSANQALRTALVRNSDVRVITLHYPLVEIHAHAFRAAQAAVCMEEVGRFREYHDKLFAAAELSDTALRAMAHDVDSAGEERFVACMEGERSANMVSSQRALGERLGVAGTPTFIDRSGKRTGMATVAQIAGVPGATRNQ